MVRRKKAEETPKIPPVYIVSGGAGTSGELIVETALAQFPGDRAPTVKAAHVRQMKQIEDVVDRASASGGTIVHTLVDEDLRAGLIKLGKKRKVTAIDLMGPLLGRLAETLGKKPAGQPGLYRTLHRHYFDRVEAIDFAMKHDDGQRPHDLPLADIVLIGVSRSGKTPLSMYLAVHGWKVANVPVVRELPPPEELFMVDSRRVIGLSIEYEHLMSHRKKRQARMGISGTGYAHPSSVFEELEVARSLCEKGGFSIISVTDKPVESIADEITELIVGRFPETR